jgi:hypothetical protein
MLDDPDHLWRFTTATLTDGPPLQSPSPDRGTAASAARPPAGPSPAGPAPRGSSLEELAQSGMLYIRRTAPRAVIEGSSLPKVRRTIITARDLVRAVPSTEEDDIPDASAT